MLTTHRITAASISKLRTHHITTIAVERSAVLTIKPACERRREEDESSSRTRFFLDIAGDYLAAVALSSTVSRRADSHPCPIPLSKTTSVDANSSR